METAQDRFKDMPELIVMVASHLDHKDITSFRLTCHKYHDICQHFQYRDVRLTDRWTKEGLQTLANSARLIRSLASSESICTLYYSSISHALGESTRPVGAAVPLDESISSPSTCSATNLSSPRWTSPTQLIATLSRETLRDLCDMHCFPAKFLYVASLSPRLTVLNLEAVRVDATFELYFLARALSSMSTLRSLSLKLYSKNLVAEETLKALVHNLPALLESFSLLFETLQGQGLPPSDEEDNDDEARLVDTVSALIGPITERKEPLRRLTDWGLVITFGDIEADVVVPLFEFLPELVSIDVPSIGLQAPVHTFDVATRISKACPKLRHLRKLHTYTDKEGTMALAFLHSMPVNTVESLHIARLSEDVRTFGDGLDFHKESIKSIVFDGCRWIDADSLVSIFFQSSNLEVFRISMSLYSRFEIPLERLVTQQWASTKFRELELCLRLTDNEQNPEHPADALTIAESIPDWAIGLERFYRQVGALAQLRILDLKVAVDNNRRFSGGSYLTYKDRAFPGLLTLGDRSRGRLGWLQLLDGLRNLEELHGSFNLDAMVPGFGFDQDEADWIVSHWPRLKFIELYTHSEKDNIVPPPSVQSMMQRLPGLKVARTACNRFLKPGTLKWIVLLHNHKVTIQQDTTGGGTSI
ncbi:hypothetical protein EC957_010295 [Mortierella hygrophila]|uniref:F-box domain-containing protein n=1 Tax=Mortierella hygrophila TaxID=979708 RepID=A0A9P6F9E2_9FUNG|nr:hypothetical protein EC957_010295 [Mortierella hygrophila]